MARRIIISNGKKYIVTTPDHNDEETNAQAQAENSQYTVNPFGAGYCDSAGSGSIPSSDPQFPLFIVFQPQNIIAQTGSNIGFTASVAPYSFDLQDPRFWANFQWYFNGAALVDGPHITGSLSNTLIIYNMIVSNTGSYVYSASNAWGSVLSNTASLSLV